LEKTSNEKALEWVYQKMAYVVIQPIKLEKVCDDQQQIPGADDYSEKGTFSSESSPFALQEEVDFTIYKTIRNPDVNAKIITQYPMPDYNNAQYLNNKVPSGINRVPPLPIRIKKI
jgi:hypothetical protein